MTLLEKLKAVSPNARVLEERVSNCVGMTQEEIDFLPIGALIETRRGKLRGYYVYMGGGLRTFDGRLPADIITWVDATLSKENYRDDELQMVRGDTQFQAQPYSSKIMLLTGKSPIHDSIRRIA